ncbi:STAS domain-containing protein [Halodesulfovibrio sp.]|jgi:anti-sigma B factor antagonist|uniref:STAS domain-containing protein n=1 Tax=Halodesulfovibrio sp. TaxID=1912772 RepID=UPI0025DDD3E3|nr:STAS domain-containing protein [Halodesulfovibrio sp.]MCT4535561.1 STAS domain-containing protein [Halodesulfovibrio sp.]
MQLNVTQKDDFFILQVDGRMDAANSVQFENECMALFENGMRCAVVDLGKVEYISSAGLRSILVLAKKLRSEHGEIRFCELHGMVEEVFTISGFNSMFAIYDSCDAALAKRA